jgi:DNA-binding HxlR family transcriptional regulator
VTTATATLDGVLADRDSWRARNCSIARALEIVGTRSAMLLIREAYYGARRFEEFVRRTELTEAVTAARLRELVTAGIFAKVPYRDPGQRQRDGYELTAMGRDLLPVSLSLMRWADKHLAERGGPIAITHSGCEAPVDVRVVCAEGHDVALEELTVARRRRHET